MRKEFFNNLAEKWDDLVAPEAPDILTGIVAGTGLGKGFRVLDVGCGTGILTPILLEAVGEAGEVTGVDFAGEMVVYARSKKFGPNARFVEADAAQLPFEASAFDAAICNNVFPHFPDKAAALTEISRVLRPGGILVICHTSSREAVNRMHRQIGGAVGEDMLPPVSIMQTMLTDAGFEVRDVVDGADVFVIRALR
ncbi:MAG: methyltransferase domain-containing protein [Desulforudis sp.]|nr:MAG: methyltransferase domain-containing protein [Desulforudis sp.]